MDAALMGFAMVIIRLNRDLRGADLSFALNRRMFGWKYDAISN